MDKITETPNAIILSLVLVDNKMSVKKQEWYLLSKQSFHHLISDVVQAPFVLFSGFLCVSFQCRRVRLQNAFWIIFTSRFFQLLPKRSDFKVQSGYGALVLLAAILKQK